MLPAFLCEPLGSPWCYPPLVALLVPLRKRPKRPTALGISESQFNSGISIRIAKMPPKKSRLPQFPRQLPDKKHPVACPIVKEDYQKSQGPPFQIEKHPEGRPVVADYQKDQGPFSRYYKSSVERAPYSTTTYLRDSQRLNRPL